jgi:hypothetical protein
MFFADLKDLPEAAFKRLTGVRPTTFLDMSAALSQHLPSGGRKPTLCREDRLLLTLMYWREYRTQFHIGQTYGLSESAVCRTIHTVEEALLRCGQFTLPGKKALTKSDIAFEVIIVDATECPVERPKKTERPLQRQKEASHPKSANRR